MLEASETQKLTVTNPAALRVAPGGAGVGPEHSALAVLHHQDGRTLVTDPAGHLLQRPPVGLSGEEKPPVRPVLKQQVGVDEEDGRVVQTGAVFLKYQNQNCYSNSRLLQHLVITAARFM